MQRFVGVIIGIAGLVLLVFPDHLPIVSASLASYWLRATGGGLLLIGIFLVWAAGG